MLKLYQNYVTNSGYSDVSTGCPRVRFTDRETRRSFSFQDVGMQQFLLIPSYILI